MTEAETMKSWTRKVEPAACLFKPSADAKVWDAKYGTLDAESYQFDRRHIRVNDRWFDPQFVSIFDA